jgi:hypothetical protein
MILDSKKACQFLNIHKNTLLNWSNSNIIPGRKVGRKWFYVQDDLENWVRSGYKKCTKEMASGGLISVLKVGELDKALAPKTKNKPKNLKLA